MSRFYYKVRSSKDEPEKLVNISIRMRVGRSFDQITSTPLQVQLKHWDLKKQTFKRSLFADKKSMLQQINDLETFLLEKYTPEASSGWLNKTVDLFFNPPEKKATPEAGKSMLQWIESFIDNAQKSTRVTYSYYNVLDLLREFNPALNWEDLDLDFYDSFTHFLVKKDLAKNTIADKIKVLKVFCNAAFNREVHTNAKYKLFKKVKEDSLAVYLNDTELDKIAKCNLCNHPHLETVRDLFLIGCWTGCRFSDIHKVTSVNIHKDFIYIEQQKTEQRVIVPLHPVVKSILEKYKGTPPEPISNQKFNKHIKKVVLASLIRQNITTGITRGGKRINTTQPKYELISSHTARRSFATNLYKSGFPAISIMAITGHQTQEAFLRYIKVTEEEHATLLMKHWRALNKKASS